MNQPNFIKLTDEQVTARKRRNLAIALLLVGFIVLVYIVTITNLKRNTEASRLAAEAALTKEFEAKAAAKADPAPVVIEAAPTATVEP